MKIALLGWGTVAKGTADALKYSKDIEIAKVLVRSDKPELGNKQVRKIEDIVCDGSIGLVAELMGGEEPALTYVKAALNAGKHVVTANKLMFSLHYEELIKLAREKGVSIAFSASAGGGIPWLVNLQRFKRVGKIEALGGIMNGTTNFILDSMSSEGSEFEDALAIAQQLGYAEADPTADIDALDVKAKLALSCDCAWDVMIDPASIPALGIRYITSEDIEAFRSIGMVCKLIGRAERTEEGNIAAYVEPMLFPKDAPEAGVSGAGNIISVCSTTAGKMSFAGGGAGRRCTGSAVAGDICDILQGISIFDTAACKGRISASNDAAVHRYYLRIDEEVEMKEASVTEMNTLVQAAIKAGRRVFAASFTEA